MNGQLTIIDLNECDEDLVRSREALNDFLIKICDIIEMKRFGDPIINRFGQGKLEGYSGIQLIETSNVIVHLDEDENKVFVDIFSCKNFDAEKAENFSKNFFKARKSNYRTIMRK